MKYYKLTDQNMQTFLGFQWEIGKWVHTSGKGSLCTKGWLHCYTHPLLAILLNPIHANIKNPKLFRVSVKGKRETNKGLKLGFSYMKLVKEIPVPTITLTQKIAFGILCAKEVYKEEKWNQWANNWLSGKDRSKDASAAFAIYDAAGAAVASATYAYAVASAAVYDAAVIAAAYNYTANVVAATAAYAADVVYKLDLIKLAKKAIKY